MDPQITEIANFLARQHPYDALLPATQHQIAAEIERLDLSAGAKVYGAGDTLAGLYIVATGEVEVWDEGGDVLSHLGPSNSFGERGLLRGGQAVTSVRTLTDTTIYMVPAPTFHRLLENEASFAQFFRRGQVMAAETRSLASARASDLMGRKLITCAPDDSIQAVAGRMRDESVSSVLAVSDGRLVGIVTTRDMTNKVLAEGISPETPVSQVLTHDPVSLPPDALGADILLLMLERRIGHVPIVDGTRPVGVLTQTDLTRYQAVTAANLTLDISQADTVAEIAEAVARIPNLLTQLIGAGQPHVIVTRHITDIGDAATRRLLALAEAELGPPPVPYLWLACGSQGRQEQSGVSDQDNCLFLDDAATDAHDAYFAALAKFVSDGLDACGYYYCPGEMMATTPRWRQPVRVWREYFAGWVRTPDPMAQMLASVMFDLRPIAGDETLFANLHEETLEKASQNSIFVAHMVANSLKHAPPLSMFRGLSTIRSGEQKDTVDLKMNGVVPVVDLGRIYALQGRLTSVSTHARLSAAIEAGVVSQSGGRDLLAAYEEIATARLKHQAARVRAGEKPDNFMKPAEVSDLERRHLRDAFVVVKTMQSALAQGRESMI